MFPSPPAPTSGLLKVGDDAATTDLHCWGPAIRDGPGPRPVAPPTWRRRCRVSPPSRIDVAIANARCSTSRRGGTDRRRAGATLDVNVVGGPTLLAVVPSCGAWDEAIVTLSGGLGGPRPAERERRGLRRLGHAHRSAGARHHGTGVTASAIAPGRCRRRSGGVLEVGPEQAGRLYAAVASMPPIEPLQALLMFLLSDESSYCQVVASARRESPTPASRSASVIGRHVSNCGGSTRRSTASIDDDTVSLIGCGSQRQAGRRPAPRRGRTGRGDRPAGRRRRPRKRSGNSPRVAGVSGIGDERRRFGRRVPSVHHWRRSPRRAAAGVHVPSRSRAPVLEPLERLRDVAAANGAEVRGLQPQFTRSARSATARRALRRLYVRARYGHGGRIGWREWAPTGSDRAGVNHRSGPISSTSCDSSSAA